MPAHYIDLYETSDTLTKLMDIALDRMNEGESIFGLFDLTMAKREELMEAITQRARMLKNVALEKAKVQEAEKRLAERKRQLHRMDSEIRRAMQNAIEEFDLPLPIKDGLVTVTIKRIPDKVEWEQYDVPEEFPAVLTVDLGTRKMEMATKVRTKLAAFDAVEDPEVFRVTTMVDTQQTIAKSRIEAGQQIPGAWLEQKRTTISVR